MGEGRIWKRELKIWRKALVLVCESEFAGILEGHSRGSSIGQEREGGSLACPGFHFCVSTAVNLVAGPVWPLSRRAGHWEGQMNTKWRDTSHPHTLRWPSGPFISKFPKSCWVSSSINSNLTPYKEGDSGTCSWQGNRLAYSGQVWNHLGVMNSNKRHKMPDNMTLLISKILSESTYGRQTSSEECRLHPKTKPKYRRTKQWHVWLCL